MSKQETKFFFDSCFDIGEVPRSPGKWNWNWLYFLPFIFTFEQGDEGLNILSYRSYNRVMRVGRSKQVLKFGCPLLKSIGQVKIFQEVIFGCSLMHCVPLMLR